MWIKIWASGIFPNHTLSLRYLCTWQKKSHIAPWVSSGHCGARGLQWKRGKCRVLAFGPLAIPKATSASRAALGLLGNPNGTWLRTEEKQEGQGEELLRNAGVRVGDQRGFL